MGSRHHGGIEITKINEFKMEHRHGFYSGILHVNISPLFRKSCCFLVSFKSDATTVPPQTWANPHPTVRDTITLPLSGGTGQVSS